MAPSTAPVGASIRVRADKSDPGSRDADLPGCPPGTWPVAALEFVDTFQKPVDPPAALRLSTGWVQQALAAGWATAEGHRVETRPAGKASDPWAPTPTAPSPHVFHHYDAIVLKGMDGDLRYRVTHQPDKYAEQGDDDTPVTDEVYASGETRVDHFYDLALEG